MSICAVTRRATLLNFGAFAAAGLSGCNAPQPAADQPVAAQSPAAPSGYQIGNIVVNTSGLLAQSGDPTAAWVQQALPGQLARAFAAHMAPAGQGGGTLTVRINSIVLGSVGPGGSATDSVKGVATLSGAGADRSVNLRSTTQYTPTSVDQALWEQALQGRVTTLSQSFAFWLARRMRH
jgi:hypothetical protein